MQSFTYNTTTLTLSASGQQLLRCSILKHLGMKIILIIWMTSIATIMWCFLIVIVNHWYSCSYTIVNDNNNIVLQLMLSCNQIRQYEAVKLPIYLWFSPSMTFTLSVSISLVRSIHCPQWGHASTALLVFSSTSPTLLVINNALDLIVPVGAAGGGAFFLMLIVMVVTVACTVKKLPIWLVLYSIGVFISAVHAQMRT